MCRSTAGTRTNAVMDRSMLLLSSDSTAATLIVPPGASSLASAPSTALSLPRAASNKISRYSRLATRSDWVRVNSS
jgi:hypothetical protein